MLGASRLTVKLKLVVPLSPSSPLTSSMEISGNPASTATVFGALSIVPSLTMSCATYTPAWSASKVGITAVGSDSTAVLPAGTDVNDHEKVSGSPSTSLDPLPSSVTVSPITTV